MKNIFLIFAILFLGLIFTVQAQTTPSVNVISPDGTENFDVGETITIEWEVDNLYPDIIQGGFNIYMKDANNSAKTITVAENLDVATRAYSWKIPNTESGFYRVIVNASFLDSSNTSYYSSDESDNIFLVSTHELRKFAVDGTVFFDKDGDGWRDGGEDTYFSSGGYECEDAIMLEGLRVNLSYTGISKEYPFSICGNQDSGKYAGSGVYFESDPIPEGTEITLTLIEPEGWRSTWPDPVTHVVKSEYHFGFALTAMSDSITEGVMSGDANTIDSDASTTDVREVEMVDISSDTTDDPTTTDEGDPDEPVITRDIPNTDTTDTGERVMQPEFGTDAKSDVSQNNQSNLDFLRERADVSASAVEVRGWDPEKKESFLRDVKEHAEVKNEQDLENFAKGILLRDENIDSIDIAADKIKITHRTPVKFLGIFDATLPASTEVDKQGRVKVKFPWYGFFFSNKLSATELETNLKEGGINSGEHKNPISKAVGVLNTLVDLF
ncbi:MAG: hypothetical protein R3251_00885 [Candidatus Spechtbacterales bacterium]|nr:hypothetical protein [Candidatus Spechtbacterales bacterium]